MKGLVEVIVEVLCMLVVAGVPAMVEVIVEVLCMLVVAGVPAMVLRMGDGARESIEVMEVAVFVFEDPKVIVVVVVVFGGGGGGGDDGVGD